MKKTVKRILITLGIFLAIIVLFFVGYMIKAKSEVKKMTPNPTKEIVNHIFSINDSFVNMYLIEDSSQYIAIDAGNSPDAIAGELKKMNINPEKIVAIFLTHSDGDHVAAIKLCKNAKIYLSKKEQPLITGEKSRFLFFGNKIDAKEYTTLEDQQVITIGNIQIKGILTEGHTIGSMCYVINNKYLFTGDALSLKNGKIAKFNEFFNMDTKTAIQSMTKITNIPDVDDIFTAHHGFTDNYKKAVQDWNGQIK
jgi:hydroxyacylglutathione hydrolase